MQLVWLLMWRQNANEMHDIILAGHHQHSECELPSGQYGRERPLERIKNCRQRDIAGMIKARIGIFGSSHAKYFAAKSVTFIKRSPQENLFDRFMDDHRSLILNRAEIFSCGPFTAAHQWPAIG
jgi:hypothetical protein